jgi:site-specific DNA-methyltransferase (adenine-specific)
MLEKNKIYCMDCLEGLKDIESNTIDLIVTSPPYDDLRDYKGYSFNFKDLVPELYRIIRVGGVVVWVVGDSTVNGSESGNSFRQAIYFMDIGFNLFDTMIYQKRGFAFPSSNRYHQVFEYMFVLSKGKPNTFNPIKDRLNRVDRLGGDCNRQKDGSMRKGDRGGKKLEKFGMRFNVWEYVVGGGHTQEDDIAYKHPATFPLGLARDHVISWSNPCDLVCDPFLGSGTTAVACKQLGRDFIGFEISQEYVDIANKRLEQEVLASWI